MHVRVVGGVHPEMPLEEYALDACPCEWNIFALSGICHALQSQCLFFRFQPLHPRVSREVWKSIVALDKISHRSQSNCIVMTYPREPWEGL